MAKKKRAKSRSSTGMYRVGPKTKIIRGKRHRSLGASPHKTVATKRAKSATYGSQKAVVVPLKIKKTVTERAYGVFVRKVKPKKGSYWDVDVSHMRVD